MKKTTVCSKPVRFSRDHRARPPLSPTGGLQRRHDLWPSTMASGGLLHVPLTKERARRLNTEYVTVSQSTSVMRPHPFALHRLALGADAWLGRGWLGTRGSPPGSCSERRRSPARCTDRRASRPPYSHETAPALRAITAGTSL